MIETDDITESVVSSIAQMKEISTSFRKQNLTTGFVPTMGCLHEGHLTLVRNSLQTCDRTVVSIFVNPTQFGPNEDLDTYPRELKNDIEKLEALGVDAIFFPDIKEMYPAGHNTTVQVQGITQYLCGKSRPELFKGVTTVVLKLFNIVRPDHAFFGEKDWQQLAVIEAMVQDLNLDVVINRVAIVREPDGLALSSRNKYLSPDERQTALSLSRSLQEAQSEIRRGTTSAEIIIRSMRNLFLDQKGVQVDYIFICDPESFKEKEQIRGRTLIALAVKVGPSRLIDNCIVEEF
ncbi:MAG: pantoate--beta-alanine ligase [Nitrospinaceae bacterium]|nr:pantoate--beta-alanine ligase [Nitrospinaceae bacterium]MBT6346626.1 pantoate--beta-alanine ligase [Nitrospina sp.]